MNLLEEGLRWLSEERCRGCGARGEGLLCPECTRAILWTGRARRIRNEEGMVMRVSEVYSSARYLGERDGILGELVEEYKYMSRRGMEKVLAEVVNEIYIRRYLLKKRGVALVILVPMPTARKHIRSRGLDHITRICREIERQDKRVEVGRLVRRKRDTVQVGASEEKRKRQAKEAVKVDLTEVERMKERILGAGKSSEKIAVVMVDDVWTTGASLLFAGKALKVAGVGEWGKLYALAITKNRAGRSPEIMFGKFY